VIIDEKTVLLRLFCDYTKVKKKEERVLEWEAVRNSVRDEHNPKFRNFQNRKEAIVASPLCHVRSSH